MLNLENVLTFTPVQFDIISHVLTIGYAAHFAGLAYFVLSRKNVAPRYRSMTTMSVVVMLSAALLLLRLDISFQQAFEFDGTNYVLADSTFSHGYRYLNWLIDVPLLLTQSLFVMNIAREKLFGLRVKLATGGVAMVVTGYIGQFYEVSDPTGQLLIWGAISTLPFIYFSLIFWKLCGDAIGYLPGEAAITMRNIRYLFAFAWGLYPIAYLVPVFAQTGNGAVTRTILFTVADVLSKIIYGIMLGKIATARSVEEGYEVDGYEWLKSSSKSDAES